MNTKLQADIDAILPAIRDLRHDLHAHPQIAFEETYAAEVIARELTAAGIEHQTGVARTGIVAWILPSDPQAAGREAIALRGDMDALNMTEASDLPYASQHEGCMHGCGHDGHMAMLLGAAKVLNRHRDELPRPVKLLFQPAEEIAGGAELMIKEGALDERIGGLSVGAAFALHGYTHSDVGRFELHAGPGHAGVDSFAIHITGDGAHGSKPHLSRDPVAAALQIGNALQTIVSRNIDPTVPAVVSVTLMRAGSASNVIPDKASLGGTIRWFTEDVGRTLCRRITEITEQIAAAMGCTAEAVFTEHCPPVVNAPAAAAYFRSVATDVFGPQAVEDHGISMGAEDFCYFTAAVPGCMARIGLRPAPDQPIPGIHNQAFNFNDDALGNGMAILAELALRSETLPLAE